MRSETLHAILPLSIVAGLAFSLFAAVESLDPALQGICSVSPFFSCHKVDQSAYTTTLGIQDYLWGIAGFVVLFALDVQVYRQGRGRWLDALTLVSAAGLAFAAYLAWLELGVIGAFCLVCLGAYLSNAVTFLAAFWLRRPSSGSGRSATGRPAAADK
ncbi:MAG: vitamin K epoxide reductase family protein [Thermoplasmata archaeon]|nr:vitamin K epoxide reductase family protein [Thermoplasmata archaeon]